VVIYNIVNSTIYWKNATTKTENESRFCNVISFSH